MRLASSSFRAKEPAIPQHQFDSFISLQFDPGDLPDDLARRAGNALAVNEVAGFVVGDAHRHRPEILGPDARIREEFGDVADLRPEAAEPFMIRMPVEDLLVFLEGAAAARAVGDDMLHIQPEKEIEVDQGEAPGGLAVPFGEMGRAAAFDLLGRDDVEPLLGEDAGGLPGHLGKDQAHGAAEEKGDAAPFLPLRGDHLGEIEAERPLERGKDPLHLRQDAGEKPVDPETANRPLNAEALIEPGGEERCLHQGRGGEHPLEDEVAEKPGGERWGVEALLLAPAEFHDRADADARRARRRAGLAVQAEVRLFADGRGEFQPAPPPRRAPAPRGPGGWSAPGWSGRRSGRRRDRNRSACTAGSIRSSGRPRDGNCPPGMVQASCPPGCRTAEETSVVAEDLSGVETAGGIEGVLDPAHDPHPALAELAQQVALLGGPDPVLAGDRPAHGEDLFVQFGEEGVDVGDLLGVALVGEGRRVEVAVAGMAEGGDPDAGISP